MKINIDYPDDEAERAIIRLVRSEENSTPVLSAAKPVASEQGTDAEQECNKSAVLIDPAVVLQARAELSRISVAEICERYIVALVMATRKPERYQTSNLSRWIAIGASSRASIALDKCARANAWLQGRDYVEPDDIRAIAHAVLSHRVTLSYDALADGISQAQVIDELLDHVVIG